MSSALREQTKIASTVALFVIYKTIYSKNSTHNRGLKSALASLPFFCSVFRCFALSAHSTFSVCIILLTLFRFDSGGGEASGLASAPYISGNMCTSYYNETVRARYILVNCTLSC